jgi:uncharacterized metal-binding protein YceD (DUF177 family)
LLKSLPLPPFLKETVSERSPYLVRFSGLSQGLHHFDFEAGDTFFTHFENSEVEKGHLKVPVILEKQSVVMRLTIQCAGEVEVMCDYCAQPFMIPVSGEQTFVIKLGNEEDVDADEDIIYLPLQEHEIDIDKYIYEVIILSIPLRRVHPEGKCDPDMVKSIQNYASKQEKDEETDPRWDALKNLKNKLN